MSAKKRESESTIRQSVRDKTLDILRRRIISLELVPGSSLSENELSQELGVSRTPVREALILLREEGLIQVFPQIGSFVSLIDLERVSQAQFIREAIECASLKDIQFNNEIVAELREILQSQRESEASADIQGFFALDEEFHKTLLQVAGHGAAWNAVHSAKAHLDRARRLSLIDEGHVGALIAQHEAVVDAIAAKDVPGATESLRSHLREVFKDIELIQAASPELFSESSDQRATRKFVSKLG
ncbi:GntR family transcriptional regulator [Glutamicibacter nicotianae]